ncbi:MAG: alpha-mannosidase [Verrucomicrobiota bacterium]
MHKHPATTETRIQNALPRIEARIYEPAAPLSIACWEVNGEPVPAERAFKARYTPVEVGHPWGGLWDTAWFRFRGTIPKAWKGREVVARIRLSDTGREGFVSEGLVYQDGKPTRAVNAYRREVEIAGAAKGGEKFEFFLEAAANGGSSEDGKAEGLNLPDYHGRKRYRLVQAELACVNRGVFDFYYDYKVCLEAMVALPEESQRRAELRYALNDALNAWDQDAPLEVAAARAALKGVLAKRNGDTVHRLSAAGNAHIDTAWLWPMRETVRKCARTFATALDYMEKYPEYVFVCSQALQYAWMKEHYPDIWERIKKAVKRGQWEPVGSAWIEPDCNLASGESLVRQILVGKKFFQKELGYTTRDMWIPDVFGYSASFPQIVRKSGLDYFLTQKISWNQYNKFPHHTFYWEGIDGSRVFSHFPPADTYIADINADVMLYGVKNFAERDRATRSLLLYGWGDGGGGPTPDHLEKARRLHDFDGLPQLEPEKAITFFEKAEADAKDLPVWVGELYLELHRGTYTTRAKNKRGNRKAEFLLREAEFFDAVSFALDREREEYAFDPERAVYDVGGLDETTDSPHRIALDRAWKLVLTNQFHDIIPGSSIHWVNQDSDRDYVAINELGMSVLDSSLATLLPAIDTAEAEAPVLVTNTLCQEREEVIDLPDGKPALVKLLACGYAVVDQKDDALRTVENPVTASTTKSGAITLNNGLLRVRFNRAGHLASVYDLREKREVLQAPGNVFHLHEDIPNDWSAWDIDIFYQEKQATVGGLQSLKVVEDGPLRAVVRLVRKFGASTLQQRIVLRAGSARLDFETEVDWQECQKLLKVAFPVAVHSPRATYEIQFGHTERPTHYNTSWDWARFEVCGQKWADLSETGYGVALLNDCKYGHDIQGNVMRLSLLRAPVSPDPVADQGRHKFTYALLPHAGPVQESDVIEEAYALNVPLGVHPIEPQKGALPPEFWFFSLDRVGVVMEAVKLTEDGKGVVVRLYEALGSRGPVEFATTLPVKKAWATNLMEEPEKELKLTDGAVKFDVKPFEIVTLKFAF